MRGAVAIELSDEDRSVLVRCHACSEAYSITRCV
jgi:hypothetical protein